MSAVRLLVAPEPFVDRTESLEAPEGLTIREILAKLCSQEILDLRDVTRTKIYVDGNLIDTASSLHFAPPAGSTVNFAVDPEGGGGSDSSKALQVVLTIAIIAVSAWVGAAEGPLAGVGSGVGNAAVRATAAALVQVGGIIAVNALFAPNRDELANANDRYALQGTSNQFRPRSPMPLWLGKRRYAFDLAAKPYSQLIGDDLWYHVVLGGHYGPSTIPLDTIKIGETLLSDYPISDYQIEIFSEPGPRDSFLYPGRVVQEDLTDLLDKGGDYEVHTTGEDIEVIEVDLTWPSGLRFNKDNGKILQQEVQGVIEYKLTGTSSWAPAPISTYYTRTGAPVPAGNFYVAGRTNDPMRRTISWTVPSKGQYDVRIKVWDPDFDDPERTVDKTYWTAIRGKENKKPILDENQTVVFLAIKASNDLNGTFPTVTVESEPVCPIWNGSDWNTAAPTSNAAALTRWLVTGPAAGVPMQTSQIHSSCEEAYELIEEYDWKGSLDLRDEMSQEDAILALGRMGRFMTYHNGSQLVFVPDWEKPVPRQLFTGRNAQGYRYRRNYPPEIHAVFVEFINIEEDSKADELYVYADGYDKTNAVLIETLRLDFACKQDRAYREGRVYLAKRSLQVESHEWTAGADSIISTLGDRVKVAHQEVEFSMGSGRVLFRHMSGPLVAGVRLDESFDMSADENYLIDVRRNDQILTSIPLATASGRVRDLMLATPLPPEDAPRKGDLVVVGRVDLVTEDVEIIDIDPQGSTAQFRARLYAAAGIQAAETGLIPPLQTSVKPIQKAPKPNIVSVNARPEGVEVVYTVAPATGSQIDGFFARWRTSPDADGGAVGDESSSWNALPILPPTARMVKTPSVENAQFFLDDGETSIDVEIVTLMRNGDRSRPAKSYNNLVRQLVLKPSDFEAAGVVRLSPDGSSKAVLYVSATPQEGGNIALLEVQLKYSSELASAFRNAGEPLPASAPTTDYLAVEGGRAYDVRARWKTKDNWVSDWVYVDDVSIPSNGNISTGVSDGNGGTVDFSIIDTILNDAGVNAETIIADALRSTYRDDALKKLGFTPGGAPLGQFAYEQKIRTDLVREDLSLIGVKSEDGLAWILDGTTLFVSPTESFATRLTSINVATAANASAITTEATVRASADSTAATQITSLTSRMGTAESAITNNYTTLSNGITAEATARLALAARVDTAESAIVTEASVRSSADSTQASLISALDSRMGANESAVVIEASTRASADSTQAGLISGLTSRMGTAESNIITEASTRAAADTTQSGLITGLNSRMGSAESNLTIQAGTIATLSGKTSAFWEVVAAAGSDPAFIKARADSYGSSIAMGATELNLFNTSGGNLIRALTLVGGKANFANPIYINVSGKRLILGPAFGAASNLVLWYGPSSYDDTTATVANGYFAIATDGLVYYGNAELSDGSGGVVASGFDFYGYIGYAVPLNSAGYTYLNVTGPGKFVVNYSGLSTRDGINTFTAFGTARLYINGSEVSPPLMTNAILREDGQGTMFTYSKAVAYSGGAASVLVELKFQGSGPSSGDYGTCTGSLTVTFIPD